MPEPINIEGKCLDMKKKNTTVYQTVSKFMNKESVAGIVFSAPFIIGFIVFLIIPMCLSFYYSLCSYNILSPPVFSGLKNYTAMVKDETFWKSLRVTFYFALVSVPLRLCFALCVALLLKRKSRPVGVYRAIYYLPSIIGGSVAVSVLWKRMFAVDGVVNRLLSVVGLNEGIAWLGNSKTAIWVLIILAVWQFGSSMLIFLSSLQQVPASLYESSKVDGAGWFAQFFKITLPLITPTIFFNLVMQMISGFLAFTQCYIITQGKPMNDTLFYTVYTYQQSFEFYNTGYAAALAWIMLVIISIITSILFATKRFWVYSEGV